MEEMVVKKVGYSNALGCRVLTCIDKSMQELIVPTSPTLCPKVGDVVWVFRSKDLLYKGFNSVAVLLA